MAGSRYTLAGAPRYGLLQLRGEPASTWRGWSTALLIGVRLLAFGNGACPQDAVVEGLFS